MAWLYKVAERPCAANNYNTIYTVGYYDPDGKWQPESDHEASEAAAARVNYLNGGKDAILAPKLLEMLIRIHAAEFGYGSWPEEREITNVINEAGGAI